MSSFKFKSLNSDINNVFNLNVVGTYDGSKLMDPLNTCYASPKLISDLRSKCNGVIISEVPGLPNEVLCEPLFTFESEETKKQYVVYTDNSKDEEGNVRVFASIYKMSEKGGELLPIKTDREWKVIETILETLQETMNSEYAAILSAAKQ